ncbi:MAG: hypothetical protein LQ347_006058 [Umbilicaria vellea]|nr:MAG: hypothetical protein LQ347_006058 [Umbilicaria vellea]
MRILGFLYPSLLTLSTFDLGVEALRKPSDSVLLSSVKTLTLRKDAMTRHRRVPAVPQLKCIGGNGKGLYDIDVMRCKNQGSDYDDENIQWTCTASLPAEFKLGSTDVICEGYESSSDPYVLKGSCGVIYRLLLTDAGEEKYGRGGGDLWGGYKGKGYVNWPGILFWAIFLSVVGWMIYSAFIRNRRAGPRLGGANNPWGWGGGGGGGPGGDDPPPPYDPRPPFNKNTLSSRAGAAPAAGQEGWRPGFWTGALGGAAAGYMAGNRGQQQRNQGMWGNQQGGGAWGNQQGGGLFDNNSNGEGSSNWGGAGRTRSSGSGPSFSSTRHESSGFGSTSRR